jgi:hypothetical protein
MASMAQRSRSAPAFRDAPAGTAPRAAAAHRTLACGCAIGMQRRASAAQACWALMISRGSHPYAARNALAMARPDSAFARERRRAAHAHPPQEPSRRRCRRPLWRLCRRGCRGCPSTLRRRKGRAPLRPLPPLPSRPSRQSGDRARRSEASLPSASAHPEHRGLNAARRRACDVRGRVAGVDR